MLNSSGMVGQLVRQTAADPCLHNQSWFQVLQDSWPYFSVSRLQGSYNYWTSHGSGILCGASLTPVFWLLGIMSHGICGEVHISNGQKHCTEGWKGKIGNIQYQKTNYNVTFYTCGWTGGLEIFIIRSRLLRKTSCIVTYTFYKLAIVIPPCTILLSIIQGGYSGFM
jgi:hypothetical protein